MIWSLFQGKPMYITLELIKQKTMNILVIQGTQSGLFYHRQMAPHRAWKKSGPEFENDSIVVIPLSKLTKETLHAFLDEERWDIVQFSIQAPIPAGMNDIWTFFKWAGTKVVLDIDDRYNFEKSSAILSLWPQVDAITTTCRFLASHIHRYFGKWAHVIENGIDFEEFQWSEQPNPPGDDVWFGYMGSTRHEEDLKLMKYDLSDVKAYSATEAYNEIIKFDKFDNLSNWNNYASKYGNIDVSLAPLVPNAFNKSKSALKAFEAGAKKRAIIATAVEPYTRYPELAELITLVPAGKSWESVIKSYTKERAIEEGEKLHKYVKENYDIRVLNKKRREIYNRII